MKKNEFDNAAKDLIYLTACAIKGETPDRDRVIAMNLEQLYAAAKHHMLTAMTAWMLKSIGIKSETFTQALAKAKRKSALLTIETNAVTARLEEEGIWYVLLKGSVLKEFYPADWMRQMTDVDILFDPSYREQVKDIMQELGFTIESYGEGNHDCYRKLPVCEFEMHVSLFDSVYSDTMEYYEKIDTRLLPNGKGKYGRQLSNEDFYLFMISHVHKHYYLGGTGLRSLLDLYVTWRRFEDHMDHAYIDKKLEQLGMIEFEYKNRELAFAVFEEKPLTEKQSAMLDYMMLSGANGVRDNLLKNQLRRYGGGRKAKIRYCMARIFLRMETIKTQYPFIYRHRILLPVLPFWRMGKGLILYRKHLKDEIRSLIKTSVLNESHE